MTPIDRTARDSIMATLRQVEAIAFAVRFIIGPADEEQTSEEIAVEELMHAIEDLCQAGQQAAMSLIVQPSAERQEAAQ